jgi:ubiquinone/menaquinone biosynthesis methyltransferase
MSLARSTNVRGMFDGIAPTYDALNRVLSLGIDQSWRRRAVAALGDVRGRAVLDICAGTLDLSVLAEAAGAQVVASDFSSQMLQRGKNKARSPLIQADAMWLPFADGVFAGALCGFGLRNLPDPLVGLREARRVLSLGARLVVLDFFRPRRAITRAVQALYNRRVLPFVGGILSGDRSAYQYLATSIERFATREEVEALAREAGFASVHGQDLTAGIAALVVCQC